MDLPTVLYILHIVQRNRLKSAYIRTHTWLGHWGDEHVHNHVRSCIYIYIAPTHTTAVCTNRPTVCVVSQMGSCITSRKNSEQLVQNPDNWVNILITTGHCMQLHGSVSQWVLWRRCDRLSWSYTYRGWWFKLLPSGKGGLPDRIASSLYKLLCCQCPSKHPISSTYLAAGRQQRFDQGKDALTMHWL